MSEDNRKLHKPLDPDEMFRSLEEKIQSLSYNVEAGRIRAAYDLAKLAHSGQLRKDGSPYVTHCVAAAEITVDMGLDEDSIVSALLHDVIEDTNLSHADIAHQFGIPVADIVEGVTKLTRVQYTSKEDEQMENLRKMLMAMAKDIRVILIKIADRLHNMRTMAYQTEDKQRSKSLETMEIYAPIAHRLGMQRAKWELEDLSLQYLDPTGYKHITETLEEKMPQMDAFMDSMKQRIQSRLNAEGLDASVFCRIKHVYSIYRKMYAQKLDINGIFDLCAFRVIVNTIPDCYNVLGIIHDMFKPVPGRFKDYISSPKPNMYQSVHTTVIGSEGIPFEVQIRTWDMHHTAEYGVAAHWKYKMNDGGSTLRSGDEDKFAWVRQLLESQQESDAQDFVHNLKIDMFADEVFVFSPKGDVINLPAGATPIDFAYSIHSDVGNRMVGAKVDGRIVPLDYRVKMGEIVEVLTTTATDRGPSRDWINIVHTSEARNKIRGWFKRERREENIQQGREELERELARNFIRLPEERMEAFLLSQSKKQHYNTLDDFYAAIGYGGVLLSRLMPRLKDEYTRIQREEQIAAAPVAATLTPATKRTKNNGGVVIDNMDNCLVKFAQCCNPVPGDSIIGFITRGYGVSIHRRDCTNVPKNLETCENRERWVRVHWEEEQKTAFNANLRIIADNGENLLLKLATMLAGHHIPVHSINARDTENHGAIVTMTVAVNSVEHLQFVIDRIKSIPHVANVERASV